MSDQYQPGQEELKDSTDLKVTTVPDTPHQVNTWIMQRPDLMQIVDWSDPKLTGTAVVNTADVHTHTFGPSIYTSGLPSTHQAIPHLPAVYPPGVIHGKTQVPGAPTLPTTPEPQVDPKWLEQARKVKHAYTFLDTAAKEMKDRAAQRDVQNHTNTGKSGERSMKSTVDAFNALTGHNLTEEEGWEFMILLKLVRGRQGDFRADDYVDAAAYSALLGECASKTRNK